MNIDIVGRIRPPLPGDVGISLQVTEGKRVHAQQGGNSHSFHLLYQPDATNQELFSKTVQPLLDLFIAGFNTCVLVYGESGSGKSFTSVGEQAGVQPGIIPQAISYATLNVQQQNSQKPPENSFVSDGQQTSPRVEDRGRLLMYHYEIYNEIIKDLMAARGSLSGRLGAGPMELQYSPERGMYVKNLQYDICRNPTEAIAAFWQAWVSRNTAASDFGSSAIFATHIFQLELYMMTDENPLPNRSTFTVIRLPGAEKLAEDLNRTRVREGPTLSKSIVAFNKLTADLARQQEPERVVNYSDSKLTSLLSDILGGNCKTRVICCLPSSSTRVEVMSAVLAGCGLLSQVKNYPIINDCLAQNLVTQYRTRVTNSLELGGMDAGAAGAGLMTRPDLQDQLLKITSDNTQLRERNDRLFQRLEQTQEKMADIAKSKSELSSKLVASEEEKLKVSKGLVELQLENNRLTEEYESENFELKNKLLALENQLVEFELEKNKFARSHDLSAEHTRSLEENRKQLAEEFIALKKKAMAQEKELNEQVHKNDEMRAELGRLIETEAALLQLKDNAERRREAHEEATKELERAKAVLRQVNFSIPPNTESLEALRARRAALQREALDKSLLDGSPRGGKNEVLSRMRQTYDEQTRKLEDRLTELKTQLAVAYSGIQEANKKCAEQTTGMLAAKEMQERATDENNRLQLEIKETNEDYRKRLWKYVQDIADFVDNGPPDASRKPSSNQQMQKYVEGMMKDMKSAFRSREEQLSNAARNYKKQSKRVALRHEKLLIHYRVLQNQLDMLQSSMLSSEDDHGKLPPIHNLPQMDLGPDPSELVISENELMSENTLEMNKLRALLAKSRAEVKTVKGELERQRKLDKTISPLRGLGQTSYQPATNRDVNNASMRMRDLHLTAQHERERADLLTRASVAEQQVKEQQEYIDTHLTRYKQEIVRLRRVISENGIRLNDDGFNPDQSPRRKYVRPSPYGF
uniref:coiled-coil domain-containing protein 78-like n=1 Tax=Ciona intestinalis TaxID=7719 RepID=UPI00089DB217|nr:coiled-coil domain-containing protein 78-like [Ciona intestinalis]|eukprot:XP_018668567.1 coiled-coil domain-containing protein 78-like [Ciona intestinalis]